MPPKIHLAFRFHGNFYHSYRGDTVDELGFGKDIRIIRHILQVLDTFNQRGVPVCGTWDFENYFSLESIMSQHCPDIIASLQRRVRDGQDEMQIMSYNNGLISAHTAREFEAAIQRAIHNPGGSGLADLFGGGVFPMVRPQEMMFTPIHLQLYPACGVDAISLYYSALPFNGFSNFVPPLSLVQRYNPLRLAYPGIEQSMTLLPCYNVGDLADHLTLRRWLGQMRRDQLGLEDPQDLLLLIDQDADDAFWEGFAAPGWLKRRFSTLRGLAGLLENVQDLDYIEFTTPGRYLQTHPVVGSISFGQDTADGSFDGLSSWVEKWSNHRLFTGLERARILDLQTRRLLQGRAERPAEICGRLEAAFEARLKLLSTTHFGMAAPVRNLAREAAARQWVEQAMENAGAAFRLAAAPLPAGHFSLLDYRRGEPALEVAYPAHPARGLVRLPLRQAAPESLSLQDGAGQPVPSAVLGRNLLFVAELGPEQRKDYRIRGGTAGVPPETPVRVAARSLQNETLHLELDEHGQVVGFDLGGERISSGQFLHSRVTYAGKSCRMEHWEETTSQSAGVVGFKQQRGSLRLPGGDQVLFERELLLAAGLPYLYLRMKVHYPRTPDQGYERGKARRLQQAWDNRWQEVLPCEIHPRLAARVRVWKHNYCDHISSFELDYGKFSRNRDLDEVNNQVTHGWLAVSDGKNGLLAAQSADSASNVAFCPLRTRQGRLMLNPFGTYWGRQYHYGTADTGLGKLLATTFSAADQIKPYAPSYNGRVQAFSLLLAPYAGDCPPPGLQHDADVFAYPYLLLNDEEFLAEPPHRTWEGSGLGEAP